MVAGDPTPGVHPPPHRFPRQVAHLIEYRPCIQQVMERKESFRNTRQLPRTDLYAPQGKLTAPQRSNRVRQELPEKE